ncbi:MAG: hypothetical protein LIO62_01615 [Clostridiales bacterium]|nr:hypothetical protein [Clostridiales bacterium]
MKKRIALWDNLKLFLIFMVVLGHLTLQYFHSSQMFGTMSMVIYTFHMPAFVFVSGLFSKRGINSDKPPIKKAFGFMMVFLYIRILTCFSNVIFGVKSEFEIFSASDVTWYMLAMGFWYIITWALRKIDCKYILITSVVIACFASYMQGDTDFLCVLRVITFYPFFYCGYIMDSEKVAEVTSKRISRIFSAVYFTAFVVICTVTFEKSNWLFGILTCRRKYASLDEYADWGGLLRLAYYIVVGLLVFSVISLCPRKEFAFSKYGARTMQIYVYHRPILYIMKNAGLFYLIRLVGEGWEWIAVLVMIALTALLCPKFWNKPIEFLLNPKERKTNVTAK